MQNSLSETAIKMALAIKKLKTDKFSFIYLWSQYFKDKDTAKKLQSISLHTKKLWFIEKNLPQYIEKSLQLINQKRFSGAIKNLTGITRLILVKDCGIYRTLGNAYFYNRQRQKAYRSYKKALELNAYDYQSLIGIGILFWSQKPKQSYKYFEKALQINPYYLYTRALWITLLRQNQQNKKAKKLLGGGKKILSKQQYQQLQKLLLAMNK